jgi:hypothetical protein
VSGHPRDPRWHTYPDTILEIYRDGVITIDLRRPLEPGDRSELAELGLSETFAVVTACNPSGSILAEAENHVRIEALEAEAAMLAGCFLRADGVAPERAHRERGVAIVLSAADALALARRYGQSSIFWYDGSDFWILPTDVHIQPVKLPPSR